MVSHRKLHDPSLNDILNVLSIGVQYTLSFQLTKFGLKSLFIVNLYSRINKFKFIKKKHANDIYTLVRTFENIKTRYEKTLLDIKFRKICKVEHLIPTFANIQLGTSGINIKLKHCIARIILEDELQHKHRQKKKAKE